MEFENPFRTTLTFSGTNYLELESISPQNGTAVLKGLKRKNTKGKKTMNDPMAYCS